MSGGSRKNSSITGFLISVLGVLFLLKAFSWIMGSRVLQTKIDVPYLDYALIVVIVLLVVRIVFVLLKFKANKVTTINDKITSSENIFVSHDNFHCAECGKKVSEKVRNYCLERPGKFKNKILCYNHQQNA